MFFLDSLLKIRNQDLSCPSCQSLATRLIHRKMMVVSLYECLDCGLRFRVPKDKTDDTIQFYQSDYDAGFTTTLPSDEELEQLFKADFKVGEKDFNEYISVLSAVGMQNGDKVLDFGASWGYGSWQFRQAGFDTYSYEVSKYRAAYAKSKLHCQVVEDLEFIRGKMDCVFSSHVLEHLPDPNMFWNFANQVLRPGGKIVCFVPNGEPVLEMKYGRRLYHQLWGQVHPLLLTKRALISMANRYQYEPYVYSFPCSLDYIKNFKENDLLNRELLLVAVRGLKDPLVKK
jgi:2-polyprenyl-3-methyl-5-hydroxy-6-metoxy-1,4-benzoquinol methylase